MEISSSPTARGFGRLEFKDSYDVEASIQISSAAREESYIWFGPNELGMSGFNPDYTRWHDISEQSIKDKFGYQDIIWNSRLHLSQSDVKALLPILTKFAETGELENC